MLLGTLLAATEEESVELSGSAAATDGIEIGAVVAVKLDGTAAEEP